MKRGKIAIALGGGGARGLAHVGVLKVLEKAKIPIDYISGTSFGSLIGSLYALNPNTDDLYRKLLTFLHTPIYRHARFDRLVRKQPDQNGRFWAHMGKMLKKRLVINLAQSRMSLIGSRKADSFFRYFLGHKTFADLQIPFVATSVDLISGREILQKEGQLAHAVVASSAIPGFLPPVFRNGQILVDGVVLNPVPIRPARELGADIVIAVDVGKAFVAQAEVSNIIDIILRTHAITAERTNALLLEEADYVIRPEVGHYHWAEFNRYEAIIRAGEIAAQKMLPRILQNLHQNETDSVYLQAI